MLNAHAMVRKFLDRSERDGTLSKAMCLLLAACLQPSMTNTPSTHATVIRCYLLLSQN